MKRWLADDVRKKFREMDIFVNSQKFCETETNFYDDEFISRNIFLILLCAQSLNESYHSLGTIGNTSDF